MCVCVCVVFFTELHDLFQFFTGHIQGNYDFYNTNYILVNQNNRE